MATRNLDSTKGLSNVLSIVLKSPLVNSPPMNSREYPLAWAGTQLSKQMEVHRATSGRIDAGMVLVRTRARVQEELVKRGSLLPSMPGDSDLDTYLLQYPSLSLLISQIRQKVTQYFGPNASVQLKVVTLPDSGCQRLYGYISAPAESRKAAREALGRLDDEWWLDAKAESNVPVTLRLEYV